MIRAIIIDDEPSSRKTLTLMLNRYKETIELVDSAENPSKGLESISKHQPDVVFLDIEMPVMNGFDMLKKVPDINFEVIFTTAYDQYAINAIRCSALDYLLKPISNDDLANAIEKCKQTILQKRSSKRYEVLFDNLDKKNALDKTIALSSLDGIVITRINDIVRCEANGRYSKFYFVNKETMLVSRTLKDFEEMLPATDFFRIHDSNIINLSYLKKYLKGNGGTVLLNDGTELDVSRRRKDEFMKLILKN